MCGVSGIVRPAGPRAADHAQVTTFNILQHHRGPDGAGRWCGDGAVLGHTRLAIVDLSDAGNQPFVSTDGSVSVVFNGEIYNHEELRHRFLLRTRDRCDGAILPELWLRLGTSMFDQLRGMYAIAVYDARARTATLGRDPFGIKPLYWTLVPDGALAFASEPRSLLPLLERRQLSGMAIRHYLMFGATDRDEAPFRGITSVSANTWVQWDDALVRTEGVIQASLFDELTSRTTGQLREEFMRTVSLHLTSDVPVALLLSSGLDSASIAWACAELGAKLTCITVDAGAGMAERAGASRVAVRFGHNHEVLSSAPDVSAIHHYFSAMQKPSIDGLNTFLVSRSVASLGMKVALSGLGGDELLAGYSSFQLLRFLPLLRMADLVLPGRPLAKVYAGGNEKLAFLLGSTGPRDAVGLGTLLRQVFLAHDVDALLRELPPPRIAANPNRDTSALALSRAELAGYLGGTLLPDADAFSMAWSVEMRVPFVDTTFACTALAVDARRGVGKRRFASSTGDVELQAIARRPKLGFTLPMDSWMRHGALAPFVRAAESSDAPVRELLRADAVGRLLSRWREGRLGWSRAWAIVSLDAWLRTLNLDAADLHLAPAHNGDGTSI